VKLIIHVSEFVDAKKRLEKIEDYTYTAELLMDRFPSFTLEDFKLATERIKSASLYERLKTAEFVSAFQTYEESKLDIARRRQEEFRNHYEQENRARLAEILPPLEGERTREARTLEEFLQGKERLTFQEKQELRERDKARRG